MKKFLLSSLCLLATAMIAKADSWVATDIANLATGDVIVIVDQTSSRALANDKGTGAAPTAVEVTLTENKNEITTEVADNIKFTFVKNDDDTYTFKAGDKALYCTNTNNGVRIGTSANNKFEWADGFLKNKATSRYIGVYNNQDWRCYNNIGSNSNIKDTKTTFYKLTLGVGKTPAALAYSAANFEYSLGEDNDPLPTLTYATGYDGTIAYESSNTDVATVDATGAVKVVAEGETTITATAPETANFYGATASYLLIVVKPIEGAENATWVAGEQGYTDGQDVESFTVGKVTFTLDGNDQSNTPKYYTKGSQLRIYISNKIIAKAETGFKISKVVFTTASNDYNKFGGDEVSEGTIVAEGTTATWTKVGGADEFTITLKAQSRVTQVYVEYVAISADYVAAPTFNTEGTVKKGTVVYLNCVTPEAEIHYTTDGTEPTNASTLYTAAGITITESCTIKAIACKGENTSEVASATFDLVPSLTLAEAIASENTGTFTLDKDLVVTYANGAYLYVYEAAEGATKAEIEAGNTGTFGLVFKNGAKFGETWRPGDVLKAGWSGQKSVYNSLIEIVPDDVNELTRDDAGTTYPLPLKIEKNELLTTDLMNRRVVIDDVSFAEATPSTKKSFTGTYHGGDETVTFYNQFAVEGKEAGVYDVQGIVSVYNDNIQVYVIDYEDPATGIEGVDADAATPAVYYNLQGVRVDNPGNGVFIKVQGTKAVKVIK